MLQFKTQVKKNRVPLIWLDEAGGARMPDCQGSKNICTLGGGGTNTLFAEYTHFRQMPFVMAAMGECYGVPDFEAMLADCVIQVKGSVLSVSGPRALNRAIGQNFTGEEMGGWEIHDRITGIADKVAEQEAEEKRVGAKVVNNLQALCQVTVPKIVIVIRKSYGQAAVNMCGPGVGPDYFVSWSTGELGFMDPTIAADVVFGNLPEEERKKMLDLMVSDSSAYPAAQDYFIQDIIDPRHTRKYLTDILTIVRDSDGHGVGDHCLANWPTKF